MVVTVGLNVCILPTPPGLKVQVDDDPVAVIVTAAPGHTVLLLGVKVMGVTVFEFTNAFPVAEQDVPLSPYPVAVTKKLVVEDTVAIGLIILGLLNEPPLQA